MHRAKMLIAMLSLAASTAFSQQELQPLSQEGPLNIKPSQPTPDKDGVYLVGFGVVQPIVLQRAEAAYPANAAPESIAGTTILTLVIGADGLPANLQVLSTHGVEFDEAAMEAVKQSTFAPGTLSDKPVPVRIYIRVHFTAEKKPAYPRVFARLAPNGASFPRTRSFDQPPVLINSVEAKYSDQARAAKLNGNVVVSLVVNEEGVPIDLKVVKPLGKGLDENALEAVSQYRFKPAMKDGAPVEAHITVQVSFRVY